MRILRRLAAATGLVAWAAIPVVGVVVLRDRADRVKLHDDAPTFIEVAPNREATVSTVGLRLRWNEPPALVAPAWTGTVSDVPVHPGDSVVDGTVVAVVDGISRPAVRTSRPFTRPLAPDDHGPEVAELNALLARRGLPHGEGDRFTAGTARGVAAFSTAIGAAPTFAFDPAWVVYLGVDRATVATVAATVAHPAPAPGEPVVTVKPTLTAATVIASQPTGNAGDAPGAETTEGDGGGGAAPARPSYDDVAPQAVPDGSDLVVGDEVLSLGEGREQVAGPALTLVAAHSTPGDSYVDAEVRTPPRPGEVAVPAAAVIVDAEGHTCVIAGRTGHPRPVPVVVITGEAGRTIVVPGDPALLRPRSAVEVAPPATRRTCS